MSHTNKDDVLSISSGLLHLSASSLIPESITKDCLENAKVLLQVDRKFIPVMAGEILVIVDQVNISAFFLAAQPFDIADSFSYPSIVHLMI